MEDGDDVIIIMYGTAWDCDNMIVCANDAICHSGAGFSMEAGREKIFGEREMVERAREFVVRYRARPDDEQTDIFRTRRKRPPPHPTAPRPRVQIGTYHHAPPGRGVLSLWYQCTEPTTVDLDEGKIWGKDSIRGKFMTGHSFELFKFLTSVAFPR